jgi:putative hydrolase of the HAD superfamily
MNNLPGAVILDLDDTIISDDAVSQVCWKIISKKYAPLIGRMSPQDLLSIIQAVTGVYWADPENHRKGRLHLYQTRRELVAQALIQAHLGDQKLGFEIADAFTNEKNQRINLIPGALETLQYLKSLSLPLALVTNGGASVQRGKIERFGLQTYFDCIIVEGDFGYGKPDKQVFEACLKQFAVDPSQAWMVGDDLNRDIGGAMNVGIRGIWVDWRQKGLPASSSVKPDRIIKTLADLFSEQDKTP